MSAKKSPIQAVPEAGVRLHPSEVRNNIINNMRASIIAWMCGIGSILILLSVVPLEWPTRAVGHVIGTLVALVGYVSYTGVQDYERSRSAFRSASLRNQLGRFMMETAPTKEAVLVNPVPNEPWKPKLIDPARLMNDAIHYPRHILLLGPTGGGKTSVANYLFSLATGEKLVITPKKRDNEYIGIPCIGVQVLPDGSRMAFDYDGIEEAAFALLSEMRWRYTISTQQMDAQPNIWFVIDESPDIAAYRPKAMQAIIQIWRIGRDARVRALMIATDQSVKALAIEGQGNVRDNLGFLRIRQEAISHCGTMIRQGKLPPEALVWLQSQDIPLMYDDDSFVTLPSSVMNPANRPRYEQIVITNMEGTHEYSPAKLAQSQINPTPTTPVQEYQSNQVTEKRNQQVTGTVTTRNLVTGVTTRYHNGSGELQRNRNQLPWLQTPDIEVKDTYQKLREQGYSHSNSLKKAYNLAGRNYDKQKYQEAKEHFKELRRKYPELYDSDDSEYPLPFDDRVT